MQFADLNLIDPLLRAVRDAGYTEPTPIQAQTIPHMLAGRDVLGCAQTGTGKTAAFALPILQRLYEQPSDRAPRRHPAALVLTPTRELAAQIADSFQTYGRYLPTRCTVIFGGVGQQPQVEKLRHGVDILIATPGRLLDLINQGYVNLSHVKMFVLDEADRMLDMGFIHDVKRVIAALPPRRQNLLFSATMPPEIIELASGFLHDPVHVEVTPTATTVDKIDQYVFFVEKEDKKPLLEHLLRDPSVKRAIVFTRTKHGANKLAQHLIDACINAEAIHSSKSQSAREAALAHFKRGSTRILVATDIAARGIDIDGITHVINYDLPNIPESYVHRIGRTARAGADGTAYSFCNQEERPYLRDIERAIRKRIQVVTDHPYPSRLGIPAPTNLEPTAKRQPPKPAAPKAKPARTDAAEQSGQGQKAPAASKQTDGQSQAQRRSPQNTPRGGERREERAASGQGGANRRDNDPQRKRRDARRSRDRTVRVGMREYAERSRASAAGWNDSSEWD
jgi:ATP-dependent RNA helicase RhlE